MQILIIANPVASGVDIRKKSSNLADYLKKRGHVVELYQTRFRGDARQRISEIDPATDRVVVVGGDGTFNEVLNGLPMDLQIPITQLPTGNANLLGKDLHLPTRQSAMADLLEKGRTVQADVATMNTRKFIMVAGIGFDARVTEEIKKIRRRKVNNFTYLLPILKAVRDTPRTYEVLVDNTKHAKGAMVLVCNVKNYAGICTVARQAGIDTGKLDVIVFPGSRARDLLVYLIHIYLGKLDVVKGVKFLTGRKITIQSNGPVPIQVDGDFYGRHTRIDIELNPANYPLLIP